LWALWSGSLKQQKTDYRNFNKLYGVCILAFGGDDSGEFKMIPILLLLLATLCYAMSTTTVKSKLMEVSSLFYLLLSFFCFIFPSIIALPLQDFFQNSVFQKKYAGIMFVSLLIYFRNRIAMMMNYRLLKVSTLFASTVTL
jgi:drug/metabolite transporter (DMT)-like permease